MAALVKITPKVIKTDTYSMNALLFTPAEPIGIKAAFTHGYTANKSDCLNWAQRLSDHGIETIIFDQPGHYLGSYNEVNDFEHYKLNAHKIFLAAIEQFHSSPEKLILGGHSLGALLALKAMQLDELRSVDKTAIVIGIGIGQHKSTHLFDTSFYEKTLNMRSQLVSPELAPSNVFPWIKEEKVKLENNEDRIHIITGLDDVVVGAGGAQALAEQLSSNNTISLNEPKKLAHHEPGSAATYINAFVKKEFSL